MCHLMLVELKNWVHDQLVKVGVLPICGLPSFVLSAAIDL